ncbi:DEAD/DEAH box helicase [Lysinibacillus irui]|uniref:DEAD/DEAH box helicase n=1 Tax=Lysinibacillus irui TaxID=2998077 RepID=UPI0040447A69
MLNIQYDESLQKVILTISEHSFAWIEIRRLCDEKAKDIEITASSIKLPWWEFLSMREELKYVFQKYRLKLTIEKSAQDLLKKSIEKQKAYSIGCKSDPIPLEEIKSNLLTTGFKRSLTERQLQNLSILCKFTSAATFSVPGAGKTTEALAYYYYKKQEDSKLIIVAPKNAFAAWEQQLVECVENPPKMVRLRGGYQVIKGLLKTEPDIILITYQQLPNVLDLIREYLSEHSFFMFIDESHRMKRGSKGKIGNSILNLSHIPENKLILSGTPMPNTTDDLVPQFNFLYPELKADETTVVEMIQPIYVRTTKEQLGLPDKKIIPVHVPMSVGQRRLYELLRSESAREAEILLKSRDRNVLRGIGKSVLRLIQVTSNPALLANSDFNYHPILRDVLLEGDSPKIQYVCNRARYLASQGKKTLIWSSFVQNVELITLRLRDLGADFIHGGVDSGDEEDSDTREYKIKKFHEDPNALVLVANPAAASEGISLHEACNHSIYLDRNYNAAQFLQSMDRIHRYGSKKEAFIEVVICPETIDDSVNRRLENKINLMAEVLNDPSLNIEFEYADEEYNDDILNEEDIRDILTHLKREERDIK